MIFSPSPPNLTLELLIFRCARQKPGNHSWLPHTPYITTKSCPLYFLNSKSVCLPTSFLPQPSSGFLHLSLSNWPGLFQSIIHIVVMLNFSKCSSIITSAWIKYLQWLPIVLRIKTKLSIVTYAPSPQQSMCTVSHLHSSCFLSLIFAMLSPALGPSHMLLSLLVSASVLSGLSWAIPS